MRTIMLRLGSHGRSLVALGCFGQEFPLDLSRAQGDVTSDAAAFGIAQHRGAEDVELLIAPGMPPGLPSAPTMTWIFVVRPPRDRPMAWQVLFFSSPGTMLMSSDNGCVEHHIFVVAVFSQRLENTL